MATRAFILIETAVGKTRDVVTSLRQVKGMKTVEAVTGPYDVVAVIEAADLNSVGETVTQKVHTVPGIVRTITCLVVPIP
ncbi:MAG: Lrp/AsnC ligand binding domain-containing protein [Dehalococcoidia bacterium]|nr:Lrp/AsnC ligand binding domain-containing protein [Dehalococcoidia bacterium]